MSSDESNKLNIQRSRKRMHWKGQIWKNKNSTLGKVAAVMA